MVLYVMCTDCENNKIQLTYFSSFVKVSCIMCMNCECRKVDKADDVKNVTYIKERETNEEEKYGL